MKLGLNHSNVTFKIVNFLTLRLRRIFISGMNNKEITDPNLASAFYFSLLGITNSTFVEIFFFALIINVI